MNRSSRRMALSGVMVALGSVVMLLGGVIPLATFCCPVAAGLTLVPLALDCGRAYALSAWAAMGAISLMLCPDKEAALLLVFLGWYPVMKWPLERALRRPWLRRLVKLLLWNACIGAMYALIFFVLRLDQIMADYQDMTRAALAVTLLMGNVTLALYDFVLTRAAVIYVRRFRDRVFR